MGRIATLIGGLLLSRTGRRMAGRHAGKLALGALAWEVWKQRHARPAPPRSTRRRARWSGRRP